MQFSSDIQRNSDKKIDLTRGATVKFSFIIVLKKPLYD